MSRLRNAWLSLKGRNLRNEGYRAALDDLNTQIMRFDTVRLQRVDDPLSYRWVAAADGRLTMGDWPAVILMGMR